MPDIVQFIHPGYEATPSQTGGHMTNWNITAKHKRKFMEAAGQYVDRGEKRSGQLRFWGEWEPPSSVMPLERNDEDFPAWLHTPLTPPTPVGICQNTDPCVFNGAFKFLICKQFKKKGPTSLARLEAGSVILFGSIKDPEDEKRARFLLDTVFVVGDYLKYNTARIAQMNDPRIDRFYKRIALHRAFGRVEEPGMDLRLYFGATFEESVEGMYSFAPAELSTGQQWGFPGSI
jgi:hypothetical protein